MSYRNALSVVGTYRSAADAEVAKGLLATVGVDSLIRSDNAGGMYPALGAIELVVRAEDAAKARAWLDRLTPSDEPGSRLLTIKLVERREARAASRSRAVDRQTRREGGRGARASVAAR